MQVTKEGIERIKSANDLAAVVAERGVKLRKKGKQLVSPCPFHQEKSASFNVSTAKGLFHCFGCGASGDVIGFVTKHDKVSFGGALEALAHRAGLDLGRLMEEHRIPDIKYSGEAAASMLRRTLDAFARMDAIAAASIIKDDQGVDDRFRAILRQLITFMMEDPRTISSALDTVWAAKAVERIGDHAKNIAEFIIFISQGVDMRHMPPEEVDRALARS